MKQLKKPVPYRKGATGKWGCDFEELVEGEVVRKKRFAIYNTKQEAEVRCNKLWKEQNPKPIQQVKKLTNAQQQEALWAFAELAKFDVQSNSLRAAVLFYTQNYKEAGETRLVSAVIDDWLKEKKQQLAPLSYAPIKSRFEQFKNKFSCKFGEVTSDELIEFIEGQSMGMRKKMAGSPWSTLQACLQSL
ncbi:hypothetical protein [Cerasicoccus maritimus]|uniref:hypothetical protein n=1 Tax=Cerasicoccus maritimus TaxID=490089 RepID=UPI0028524C06|nr:hypothetical protein [Cerasicoccus maritimus]